MEREINKIAFFLQGGQKNVKFGIQIKNTL